MDAFPAIRRAGDGMVENPAGSFEALAGIGYRAPMGLNLLMVEDDRAYASAMAEELRGFDHRVTIVEDGRAALSATSDRSFDAAILDRMLPSIDGISVLQRLRDRDMTMPVIMLSALGKSTDKIEGLAAGADDYVVKPIAAAELNARLLAMVRGRQWTTAGGDTVSVGDITVSATKIRAWRAGVALDLGKLEFRLLSAFVANPDAVLTRAMLVERVWGYDFSPTTNIVDVHVRHLRQKLIGGGGDDPIATIRGVGYMLRG